MSFGDDLAEHRRLAILRLLSESDGYVANSSVLQSAVERLGFRVSRDRVETELAWLSEQGFLTLEDLGPVKVVTLTVRGLDVAQGSATAPGVKRPRPR